MLSCIVLYCIVLYCVYFRHTSVLTLSCNSPPLLLPLPCPSPCPSSTCRYLQEYCPLGTAGGLYHFRDQIQRGDPSAFFVFNSDVHCDFPLEEMLRTQQERTGGKGHVILGCGASDSQAPSYGCIVHNQDTAEVSCVCVRMCVRVRVCKRECLGGSIISVLPFCRSRTMWRSQSRTSAAPSMLVCTSLHPASLKTSSKFCK